MEVAINPLATPHLLLVIEDDQEKIDKMKDEVWEQAKDVIELDGFRKGQIPRSLAEKKIGYKKLYKGILQELFAEAIQKSDKKIVGVEGYELDDFMEGQPIVMHAEVYLTPDVLALDYKEIEIVEDLLEVKEEEIEAVIQTAADSETKAVAVDREAKLGDQVVVDFSTEIADEESSNKKQEDYNVVLGSKVMLEDFENELVGLTKGSNKTFSIVLPENYHNVGGKTAKFEVAVKEVFELEKPAIDDALAKGIGYDSLEDFRTKVGEDLLTNKKQQASRLRDDKVMQALVNGTRFSPIPDCLVADQIESILERQTTALGVSEEDLLKKLGTTKSEYKRRYARSALQDIRARLALEAVAAKEAVEISEEERKEYITAEAAKEGKTYEQLALSVNQGLVDTNLKLKKALDLLKASVKVKVAEQEEPATEVEEAVQASS